MVVTDLGHAHRYCYICKIETHSHDVGREIICAESTLATPSIPFLAASEKAEFVNAHEKFLLAD
jgi:hypothetical protein